MNDTSFVEESVRVGSKRKEKAPKVIKEGVHATKEYAAYCKTHDPESAEDFLSKSSEELKKIISYCTVEIKEEKTQVEETPEYQKAKEEVKVFTDALAEITKPLKHTIELATLLLRDRGQNQLDAGKFEPAQFGTIEAVKQTLKNLSDSGVTMEFKKI
jgi:hypothetical protein